MLDVALTYYLFDFCIFASSLLVVIHSTDDTQSFVTFDFSSLSLDQGGFDLTETSLPLPPECWD